MALSRGSAGFGRGFRVPPSSCLTPEPQLAAHLAEARALSRFLTAGPDEWPRLAPRVTEEVGTDALERIVRATTARIGELLTVTVAKGDIVRAGQLLGEVGNTGNTTGPHLHIHAERDGVGLDLEFTGVTGRLYRGRMIRA